MSEKLSPYEFAKLLLDITMVKNDKNFKHETLGQVTSTIAGEMFVRPSKTFETYDVSEKGEILFNEDSEQNTIHIPIHDKLLRDDWPFGDTNE